ncbi:hypothetical protein LS482_09680 [Sinomicrobium kalidii]|uniref:hypothetical protein n=1 Tax=Sinomicrobium kalidii TaxID=2900738 RepID=UPI001E4423DD|nr:hypothetical protein [Sinomicrobium kalidii]UGU18137.1 hypothetical protein LS482_09680 [Sinomicrobium kalidii]
MKNTVNNVLLLIFFAALLFAPEVRSQEAKGEGVIGKNRLRGLNLNEKQSFAGVRPAQNKEKKKSKRVSHRKTGNNKGNRIQTGNYVGVGKPKDKGSGNFRQSKSVEKKIKHQSASKSPGKPALNLNQGTYVGVRPKKKSDEKQ